MDNGYSLGDLAAVTRSENGGFGGMGSEGLWVFALLILLFGGYIVNEEFELLDLLTVLSFIMQVQNQSKLFGISDIQEDNNRVAEEIHQHLRQQDEKINKILELISNEKI